MISHDNVVAEYVMWLGANLLRIYVADSLNIYSVATSIANSYMERRQISIDLLLNHVSTFRLHIHLLYPKIVTSYRKTAAS